jgi:monoamine oxidase
MHGLSFAPAPYDAAFRDWGDDPFGGGVNFWNIHVNSREAIPRIAKPTEDAPVYICGEAYSSAQGWVEGALETAELVLQDHFHLPAPDWVTGE